MVGHATEVAGFYDPVLGTARISGRLSISRGAEKRPEHCDIASVLIGGVVPSGGAVIDPQSRARLEDDGGGGGMMGMPAPAGAMANGGRMDAGHGGGAPGAATSDIDRASDTAVGEWRRDQLNQNSRPGSSPGSAGSTAGPRMAADECNPTGATRGCAGARYASYGWPGAQGWLANSSSSGSMCCLWSGMCSVGERDADSAGRGDPQLEGATGGHRPMATVSWGHWSSIIDCGSSIVDCGSWIADPGSRINRGRWVCGDWSGVTWRPSLFRGQTVTTEPLPNWAWFARYP